MAKAKKRPRKASSDRVSSLAAKWMAGCRKLKRDDAVWIGVGELRDMCASLISQDETKGRNAR